MTNNTETYTETYTYWVEFCHENDTRIRRFTTKVTIKAADPFTDVADIGMERFYTKWPEAQVIDEGA